MNDCERWCTPPEIFDPLMAEFDFDLDAAADEKTDGSHPSLSLGFLGDRLARRANLAQSSLWAQAGAVRP